MPSRCKGKKCTSLLPAIFAWFLLLAATTVYFYLVCPHLIQFSHAIPAVQGVLTAFVVLNFAYATFLDPGRYPRAKLDEGGDEDDFHSPLYKNTEINGIQVRMKWCTTCRFYRPPRCSHCSVCDYCIDSFDHHCPWMNNCIGRRNYRYFFLFLNSLILHMIGILACSLAHVVRNHTDLAEKSCVAALVLIVLVALLLLPVGGLAGFHIFLTCKGRTTNEQITGKYHTGHNPFDIGCVKNCGRILCSMQFPRVHHVKPSKYRAVDYYAKYQQIRGHEQVSLEPSKLDQAHQNGLSKPSGVTGVGLVRPAQQQPNGTRSILRTENNPGLFGSARNVSEKPLNSSTNNFLRMDSHDDESGSGSSSDGVSTPLRGSAAVESNRQRAVQERIGLVQQKVGSSSQNSLNAIGAGNGRECAQFAGSAQYQRLPSTIIGRPGAELHRSSEALERQLAGRKAETVMDGRLNSYRLAYSGGDLVRDRPLPLPLTREPEDNNSSKASASTTASSPSLRPPQPSFSSYEISV